MRTKRACDSCHGRKIQCDAAVPHCNWCKHHSLACTFNRAVRVQKKATVKKFDRTEKTLMGTQKRQILLPRYMPQGTYASPSLSPARNSSASSSNARCDNLESYFGRPSEGHTQSAFDLSGTLMGQPSRLESTTFSFADGQQWMYSTEGEAPSFQKLLCMELPWQIKSQDIPLLILEGPQRSSRFNLPDRSLVEECLLIFVSSKFGLSFPMIDPILFQLNIDLAFDTPQYRPSHKTDGAKACIFAFFALISVFQRDWQNQPSAPTVAGDAFASAAEMMLSSSFQDTNIVALQIVFMLSFYHNWSGHIEQGLMFHALSCRVVFMLGGNIQPSSSIHQSESYKQHDTCVIKYIRNIFWLCYEIDKEIALRTGHPPVINDDYCDLTLLHDDLNARIWTLATKNFTTLSTLRRSHIRLSIIKSKVSRALYSSSALRKSETEVLMNIRELDIELEEWRMSFPLPCRPPLSFSSEVNASQRHNAKCQPLMEEILLNLEYHYLVEVIHRASRRYWAWGSSQSEKLNVVSSSSVLSVQASRSTLFYLRAAIFSLEEFTFCTSRYVHLLQYSAPTATSSSKDDLALLRSVPGLIKDMRKRCLTLNELTSIAKVDEFVAEVIKLGNYAIAEASQKKGDPRSN